MKPRMPPRVGTLNVTLEPMTIARVTPAGAYLGVAEALVPAVQVLAATPSVSGVALTVVCGHALECILKAYLSKNGVSEAELKKHDVRHNLTLLWQRSQARGLTISPMPPPWVEQLSRLHNKPFHLRYPMGLHGLVLPGTDPMSSALGELLEIARRAIR